MKNSARYEKKVRKLFGAGKAVPPPAEEDFVRLMLLGVLEEDATARKASAGLDAIEEEFVDYNELRASPAKDVSECLGDRFPGGREKAVAITTALNAVFDRTNELSLEPLMSLTKRELRKTLREEFGLSQFAEAVLTLCGFGGHAIPVDTLLVEALKLDDYIHADSDITDLQGFLERIILNKDAYRCHLDLRKYAATKAAVVTKELARRQKLADAEAAAKAKAEAEAKAKAEAAAKARAEAKAKKEAAAKANKKAKAAAARKAKRAKKAAKRPAKKAAAKTRKGAAKPKSAAKKRPAKKRTTKARRK